MPSSARRHKNISDCSVLVTGATSGVGLATALAFAEAGARSVALVGRDPGRGEAARKAVAAWGMPATFHRADVTSPSEAAGTVAQVMQSHHTIDILVNCAGVGSYHAPLPFLEQDPILVA